MLYLAIDQHERPLIICARDEQGDRVLRRAVGESPALLPRGARNAERHAERSEASCPICSKIPRYARNDNVQRFPLRVVTTGDLPPAASTSRA